MKDLTLVHITRTLIMVRPRSKICNNAQYSSRMNFFMSGRKYILPSSISTIRTTYFHVDLYICMYMNIFEQLANHWRCPVQTSKTNQVKRTDFMLHKEIDMQSNVASPTCSKGPMCSMLLLSLRGIRRFLTGRTNLDADVNRYKPGYAPPMLRGIWPTSRSSGIWYMLHAISCQ